MAVPDIMYCLSLIVLMLAKHCNALSNFTTAAAAAVQPFPANAALPMEQNCANLPPGWSQAQICAYNGSCTMDTCSSCEDCLLRFPGMLPYTSLWCNGSTLVGSNLSCPLKRCSYCLGCNLTTAESILIGEVPGVAVCDGCDASSSIFWDYNTTYTGSLGLCNVSLSCSSSSPGKPFMPRLLGSPQCANAGDPKIFSLSPSGGILGGGTIITLEGNNLTNVASITIAARPCDLEPYRSTNTALRLKCRTPPSAMLGQFPVVLRTATLPVQLINSSITFQYLPNPQLVSIMKAMSIAVGGIMVNFTGQYLASAQNVTMTVAAVCQSTRVIVANFSRGCIRSADGTKISCATPDLTSVVERYRCNPQGTSSPNASSAANPYSSFDFPLGLLFDGYRQYAALTSLPEFQDRANLEVYNGLRINRFAEDGSVKTYDPSSSSLFFITGQNMDSGARINDYSVVLGSNSQCIVDTLFSNQLTCRLPPQQPAFDLNNSVVYQGKEAVGIVVSVGNMKVNIGYLTYLTPTPVWLVAVLATLIPAAAVLVAIAVAVLCVRRRRRQQQLRATEAFDKGITNPATANSYQDNVNASSTTSLDSFKEHDWQRKRQSVHLPIQLLEDLEPYALPRLSVNLGTLLGQGQFGKIFEALVNEKTTVAAKVMKDGSDTAEAAAKFLEEAVLMKDLRHPNVLGLFGVVLEDEQPIVLVQLMERGDLRSALKKEAFGMGDLVNFCLQIAHGMVYLSSQKFVHRDLAARNCLLNNSYVVKISDFGLSHELDMKDYYRGQDQTKPLPVKWMAIESLSHGVFTVASDVWSYGVVMWEIMARGSTPYADVSNYEIKRYLLTGRRLENPTSAPEPLYEIMRKCWCLVPSKRPTFLDLISLIDIFSRGPQGSMLERYFTREVSFDPYSYASCSEKKNCHGSEEYEQPYLELLPDTAL